MVGYNEQKYSNAYFIIKFTSINVFGKKLQLRLSARIRLLNSVIIYLLYIYEY